MNLFIQLCILSEVTLKPRFCFLLLHLMASRMSPVSTKFFRHQLPRHSSERIEPPERRLRVNSNNCRPCEKTHSTAVDVAGNIGTDHTVRVERCNQVGMTHKGC